jgi:GMP synthase (glutamine-hydrolysing)
MSASVLVLRHVHFEDLGAFEAPLLTAGYTIRYCEMGIEDPRAYGAADLLVILGGPIGVYEDDRYSFLKDEIALIADRVAAGQPTLGVCLGAQLIARALGARVYPGGRKEIGWKALKLSDAGQRLLAPVGQLPVLHWHGDTFDLPAGALLLGSTNLYEQQAFSYESAVLALQFHLEVQQSGFERWLIGHTAELSAAGVSVARLREDTRQFAAEAAAAGQKVISQWLESLGHAAS